jgi:DNA-binding NarL/FixJ family response regulator
VLIVDDHAEFRASARKLLEAEGFDVVGEASHSTEAFAAVEKLRPAIVLLDITMPGPDGLAIAERLTAERDGPAVVLTSSREASEYGPRLARTRARGFITKEELSGERLAALLG